VADKSSVCWRTDWFGHGDEIHLIALSTSSTLRMSGDNLAGCQWEKGQTPRDEA
jgi:hypothetical protein